MLEVYAFNCSFSDLKAQINQSNWIIFGYSHSIMLWKSAISHCSLTKYKFLPGSHFTTGSAKLESSDTMISPFHRNRFLHGSSFSRTRDSFRSDKFGFSAGNIFTETQKRKRSGSFRFLVFDHFFQNRSVTFLRLRHFGSENFDFSF